MHHYRTMVAAPADMLAELPRGMAAGPGGTPAGLPRPLPGLVAAGGAMLGLAVPGRALVAPAPRTRWPPLPPEVSGCIPTPRSLTAILVNCP